MIKIVYTQTSHNFFEEKIIEYNANKVSSFISDKSRQKLCYAYEEGFQVLAGMSLEFYWGILHINFLWVDEKSRWEKIGEQFLSLAKDIANKNACSIIYLETYSFQAPDFYKRYGFEEFGRLDNIPNENSTLYFMKKIW